MSEKKEPIFLNEFYIIENVKNVFKDGKPYLKGIKIHQAGVLNKNRRIYEEDLLKKALMKWYKNAKKDDSYRIMFADHILRSFSSQNIFSAISGVIENAWWVEDEKAIYADIRIIDKFQGGKDIYNYLSEGLKLGISARQQGITENADGSGKVLELEILGWDFVLYPSFDFYTSNEDIVYEAMNKLYLCRDELCKVIQENQLNFSKNNMNENNNKEDKEMKDLEKEIKSLKEENAKLKKELEDIKEQQGKNQKKPKVAINNNAISHKLWSDVDKIKLRNILYESGNESAIKECYCVVEDLEKMTTWHYPHHELRKIGENSYELILNYNGVMAAYKALAGARGGGKNITPTERRKAAKHLIEHFKNHIKKEVPANLKKLAESEDLDFSKIHFKDENEEFIGEFVKDILDFVHTFQYAKIDLNNFDVNKVFENILYALKDAGVAKFDKNNEKVTSKDKLESIIDNLNKNFEEEVNKDNVNEFIDNLIKTIAQINQKLEEKELEKEVELKKIEYKDIEEAKEILKEIKTKKDLEEAIFKIELIKIKKEYNDKLPDDLLEKWFNNCKSVEDIKNEKEKLDALITAMKHQKEKINETAGDRDGDVGKDKDTNNSNKIKFKTIVDELGIKL